MKAASLPGQPAPVQGTGGTAPNLLRQACAGQLLAAVAALLMLWLVQIAIPDWPQAWSGWFWLGLQPVLAVASSLWQRQPGWWAAIHLFFVPMLALALAWNAPPWLYLLAFIVCWLIFGRVDRSRVPLFLSNRPTVIQLAGVLPMGARLLDVGAGTATVLRQLQRLRPDLVLHGVEHAWLPWLLGRLSLRKRDIVWRRGDLFALNFADYDAVYAFLSPALMPALWVKARREMRPGSLLISNSFAVPDVVADRQIAVDDWKQSSLYLWKL